MKKVYSISRKLISVSLILLSLTFVCCQKKKDLLPEPKIKIGTAKISGSVVNLKLPVGEKKVELSVFVYNPITGNDGVTTYVATLNKDNQFSIDVPLECSTEICSFNVGNENNLYGWGYIGLDQCNELKLNLVFNENGDMMIDTKGGLSLTADDMINIVKAYGLFEDCHTWGDFQVMSPNQFSDNELNISLKQRKSASMDSLAFSEKIKKYLIDDINLRFIKGRLFYYKETVEQCIDVMKIKTADTVVEADKSYYSFLKPLKLNNPRYLYCEDYTPFLMRFLQIPAFKIPLINDTPIDEWLLSVKTSVSDVIGFSSGLFYDLLASKAYIYQLKEKQIPLTDKQIENIQEYFKNKNEDICKLLLASNNQLIKSLEKINDLKINETPVVSKDKLVDAIVAKYNGSVVLVDLWATWCGPCMEAIQLMKPLHDEFKQKGVIFVYITNRSSPKQTWESKIKTIGGEQYYLNGGEWDSLMEKYGFEYIPSYLIFDKNGKLKQKITSFPGVDKMRGMIDELWR